MKYKDIIADILAQRSANNGKVAIAVIAGLAIGAAIGVLFAPEKGENLRKGICDKANTAEEEEPAYIHHAAPKKPKSDIKELIHDAHTGGAHTEQSIV